MTGSDGGKLHPQYRPCSLPLFTLSATPVTTRWGPPSKTQRSRDPDGRIPRSEGPGDFRKPNTQTHTDLHTQTDTTKHRGDSHYLTSNAASKCIQPHPSAASGAAAGNLVSGGRS